jgi:hypothetical protein
MLVLQVFTPVLLVLLSSSCFSDAFTMINTNNNNDHNNRFTSLPSRQPNTNLYGTNNENENENEKVGQTYLDKASLLRKEVDELEAKMSSSNANRNINANNSNNNNDQMKKIPVYTSLKNSNWVLSYRFASDPIPNDDNDKESNNSGTTTRDKLTFYSGKVSIRLREDGYTDLIIPNDENIDSDAATDADATGRTSSSLPSGISFQKFWGWDEEISNEGEEDENKRFLSFSADVILPKSDPNYDSNNKPCRVYFNSEIETDAKNGGELSLTSGTVTVKRDVESPGGGGGFWGIFNGGGILAQFRYCGEFLMKPTN